MSRLIDDISLALERAPTSEEFCKLLARRSVYFSQKGDVATAWNDISRIREHLSLGYSAVGVIFANLAEASALFQRGETEEAILKAKRSYALSRSIGSNLLLAASAAWLSHFYFNKRRYVDAILSAKESIAVLPADEKWVLARLSLVIASMYHFFGDYTAAKPWYDRTRRAAVDEGDEVMIGLVIYNISAIRLNNFRLAEISGERFAEPMTILELEIESSSNFDKGVGSISFPELIPMLRVQMLTLRREHSEALRVYGEIVLAGQVRDLLDFPAHIRMDYALCLMGVGRRDEAINIVKFFPKSMDMNNSLDENAMIFNCLSKIHQMDGNIDEASAASGISSIAMDEYAKVKSEMLLLMNSSFGWSCKYNS